MNAVGRVIFQTLLIATFAVWFGGFTFYVSFVVPIGTEILGSAREQGFITRSVTHWLNLTCGIAAALMLVETCLSWNRTPRRSWWVQFASIIAIVLLLVGLILLHPQLDGLLEPIKKRVIDRPQFYQLHRAYLWASTFQWIFGWIWLISVLTGWGNQNQSSDAAKTPPSS